MPNFVKAWGTIKTTYEKATGKAKPSASSKSIMSKPSGIEPACKDVDKILATTVDAGLPTKATAAGDALLTKADAYVKILAKAVTTEADTTTKNALKAMETSILNLVKTARDELDEHVEPVFTGSFKNQVPTEFGSKWLTDRLPMQGFTPERKLIVALDMCKTQFVDNPYVFAADRRKFANFHRQVDAAINGTTGEIKKAIQQAKDPRHAQLRKAPGRLRTAHAAHPTGKSKGHQ